MVEPDESFITVTHRKDRKKPATADPVGMAHPETLLGTPAVPISSRFENILVTFLLKSERSSNVNQTTTPNQLFYVKKRILVVFNGIQCHPIGSTKREQAKTSIDSSTKLRNQIARSTASAGLQDIRQFFQPRNIEHHITQPPPPETANQPNNTPIPTTPTLHINTPNYQESRQPYQATADTTNLPSERGPSAPQPTHPERATRPAQCAIDTQPHDRRTDAIKRLYNIGKYNSQ
jgi:hypothetical protein